MKANIELTPAIINALFVGKTISKYDSWNGSYTHFEIASAFEFLDEVNFRNYIVLYGQGNWKGSEELYIDDYMINELLSTGKYEECHEIDHCNVRKTYELY